MPEGLAFGAINGVENATAEVATDATPRKIVNAFSTNVAANRVTANEAAGTLTIQEAGTYMVNGNISFSGTLSKTFYVRVYKNSSPIGTPCERKLGTGGDVGAASFCALAELVAGDVLSAYHWSDDGGTSFTAHQICLNALRIK